jgi:hypothetical protein
MMNWAAGRARLQYIFRAAAWFDDVVRLLEVRARVVFLSREFAFGGRHVFSPHWLLPFQSKQELSPTTWSP